MTSEQAVSDGVEQARQPAAAATAERIRQVVQDLRRVHDELLGERDRLQARLDAIEKDLQPIGDALLALTETSESEP